MQTSLRADVTLPRTARAVTQARHTMAALVAGSGVADDAELLISEAVANAVQHTGGPVVRLSISHDFRSGELLCRVGDASPEAPRPEGLPDPGHDGESGRGLHLITALSDGWGYERHPRGKHLWFRLRPGPAAAGV